LDSPWALTSISQRQFWTNVDFSQLGNGAVRGILSVDISEWQAPGVVYGKPAEECIAAEIQEEVWTQLKEHLNVGGTMTLDDHNRLSWFLDPDIEFRIRARRPTPSRCSSTPRVRCSTVPKSRWN
jgi:hypothetical protein